MTARSKLVLWIGGGAVVLACRSHSGAVGTSSGGTGAAGGALSGRAGAGGDASGQGGGGLSGTAGKGREGAEAGGEGEGGEGNAGRCESGTFDHDGDPRTPCRPWSTCESGGYVFEQGTGETDRVCAACGSGTFSSGQDAPACDDWTTCLPGEYVSVEGSTTSDRECRDCPDGTQSTRPNQPLCQPPGACEPGTVEITPATPSDPAKCDACPVGTFCAGGSASAVDCDDETWDHDVDPGTVCAERTRCVAGSYVADPGSATDDRACVSCASGTFSTVANAMSCDVQATCAAGSHVTSAGTATSDRVCATCSDGTFSAEVNAAACRSWTACAPGSYVATAGSTTADRSCASCANGTFSTGPNAVGCNPWTTCGSTWALGGVARAGTATADTVCGMPSPFRQFGTFFGDFAHDIAVDAGDHIYVVGVTGGNLGAPNVGGSDTYLRKYDAVGSPLWTQQFGTPSNDVGTVVAVDASGGIYVAGATLGSLVSTSAGDGDAFLRKYDASGLHLWTRQFGTPYADQIVAVAVGSGGNVYVAGTTDGALGGARVGGRDAFLRKYDAAGTHQWTQQFGTTLEDYCSAVAVDANGDVYLTGYTYGALTGSSAGGTDIYLRKYDSAGTHQWTQQFGTSSNEGGDALAIDSSGNVYLAGDTQGLLAGVDWGGWDGFLRKYDSAGIHQWTRQFRSSGWEFVRGAAVDANGNVYVSGYTTGSLGGTNAGQEDGFLCKYDAAGTPQWTQQFGTSELDRAESVAVDSNSNVYVAGHTPGSLGGTSAGSWDAFVLQIPAE